MELEVDSCRYPTERRTFRDLLGKKRLTVCLHVTLSEMTSNVSRRGKIQTVLWSGYAFRKLNGNLLTLQSLDDRDWT